MSVSKISQPRMEDHVEVARPFDDIKDIDDSKDIWTLSVRIVDVWPVITKFKSEHIEMVIMDAQSERIQVTVPKEFMAEFKQILYLNNTLEMENFKVCKNEIVVKATPHLYRLIVTGATVITPEDFPAIPMARYHFKDFEDVLAGKYRPDLLVDAIGAFQEVTNTNRSSGRLRSITFLLKDASGKMLHCCLWDDYAKQFSDALASYNGADEICIILKHCRIKAAQGNYPLCFTNSWDGTQLLFNPVCPEVAEFRELLKLLPADDAVMSQNVSQFSQGSQLSTQTDIMSKATFLSLSEINDIKNEVICVTVAEIKKLNATRYGWTYNGCKECTKVVKMDDGELKCVNGHVNEKPVPRYKVEVQAEHKVSKARFLFWDEITESILGISAADLREQMIQAGHTNPKTYPKLLDNLVSRDKKKVFKIKAYPGLNPCSIIQISESEQLLGNLLKQFGLEEESESKNVAREEDLALEAVSETKDLSQTPSLSLCGENEPSVAMSTPPTKRLSQAESDSATKPDAEDVQPTQLSSTKFAKNPKNAKTPKLEKK